MTEEIKPIKPVTLDAPKLKELDKTPLTRCELCLHFVRRVDNEHVFCMMYGETPHVTEYCEKFTPVEKDPVLAYIYRYLLGYDTGLQRGVSDAISTALYTVTKELREAELCKNVDIVIDYCSDEYTTCRAIVTCDNKKYGIELSLSVKATISHAEREG